MTGSAAFPAAIVLGGHIAGLAVTRALGAGGVPVVVAHSEGEFARASRWPILTLSVPDPLDDEQGYVDAIRDTARRFSGALLMPTSDEALTVIAKHAPDLAQYFLLGAPAPEHVSLCLDKLQTDGFAVRHGIPAPRSLAVDSAAGAAERAKEMEYPLLVKPLSSHVFYRRFGKKMAPVANETELREAVDAAVSAGTEVMLQEIIEGSDDSVVNYNSYADRGRILAEFTARQLRKAPPAFGFPRVVVSETIPEAIRLGRMIVWALELSGFSCIEIKRDQRDGVFKLIEINARHNLSGALAVRCGVNFPLLEYRHRTGGWSSAAFRGSEPIPSGGQQNGCYWVNSIVDLIHSVRHRRIEGLALSDYARPYFGPVVDAVFDPADPKPAGLRLAAFGSDVLRRMTSRRWS